MDYQKLAELLFPGQSDDVDSIEKKYPPRNLPDSAKVTRFAPSPTGYLHFGGLFSAFADILTAKASGGVSFLRIEDTDKKREIENGVKAIIDGFNQFGLEFTEGITGENSERGGYRPYKQSQRVDIYHTVAKKLVEEGKAYPCFCTEEELADIRQRQEAEGSDTRGYFGKWAKWRDADLSEIEKKLEDGRKWVLRFRSEGNPDKKIVFRDVIRGNIEMPENIIDEVLLKSDGVPTYHFAHVCDDHFMRTTHVIRGEEWISSVPKHIQMFKACGFKVPKYAHTPQVMKIDEQDGTKRKLSKRKDPEAAVSWFADVGYPAEAVLEYLLTLLNSNFEDWRRANKDADIYTFPFDLKKLSVSGCLFDTDKLNDISKTVISKMKAGEVYDLALKWAEKNDAELYKLFSENPEKAKDILNIDRENKKPRKDIAKWSDIKNYVSYFYTELYKPDYAFPENIDSKDESEIINEYIKIYSRDDDKDAWFEKIKSLCEPLGFCPNVKEYKKSPENYKGHIGDVSSVIRVAVTSRTNTPDLYYIMKILGYDEVISRLKDSAAKLN